MEWLLTLTPIIAMIINVICYLMIITVNNNIKLSVVLGLALGLTSELAIFVWLLMQEAISLDLILVNLLTYLGLSACFFAFLNLNITSLRIRLLREILAAGHAGLNADNLLSQYSPKELVSRRIQRLVDLGQIHLQKDKWVLQSSKLLLLVNLINGLRIIIFSKKTYLTKFKLIIENSDN